MSKIENTENLRNPSVVIIGAGMTGLLLNIKLREAGITDVTLLEKTDRLGGTWRENTYPGVACDVPAHMYTYSFESNPGWKHLFAHGDEIQAYFERVGRKYGVTNTIRFNEAVTSCTYARGQWRIETSKQDTLTADFVINCTGILHHPTKPDIKGIERFQGAMFHTAEWDHSVSLEGKRVGIIGTGSTAAQVIPEVAKTVKKLSIFQRTPQWIIPLGNKEISEKQRENLRKNPNKLRRLRSFYEWGLSQLLTKAVTGAKLQNALFSYICKKNLALSIKDPVLRKKLTPDYKVGCKRIIINNTFYPAVQRENVDLVTDGIVEITEKGIKTADGTEHELDALVLSTGFDPTAYMRPMNMVGKNNLNINTAWQDKIQNYRSMCMPGFPNNFLMLGPNTPIGNYSVIAMSEVQCGYILKVIDQWRDGVFDEIDVKPSAVSEFADYMRAGMKNTVWVGGCQSWYLDKDGDPILWPYTWARWEKEMNEPLYSDFNLASFEPKKTSDKNTVLAEGVT